MKLKNLVLALVLLFFVSEVFAIGGGAAKVVKDIRAKATGEIVKCNPTGSGDCKKPSEAITMLKKGMTLQLAAGAYPETLMISCDGVIVEGEPGKKCEVSIEFTGKGCAIKNLYCNVIESNLDITIVDSVILAFVSEKDSRGYIVLENSCVGDIDVMSYNKTLEISGCTFANAGSTFLMHGGKVTIEKSVLYAGKVVFMLGGRRPKIEIDSSVVYGNDGFAKDIVSGKTAKTMDDVKKQKFQSIVQKKNVMEEKPLLGNDPTATTNFRVEYLEPSCQRWDNEALRNGAIILKDLILKENSPGKKDGFGANLNAEGFPVPAGK